MSHSDLAVHNIVFEVEGIPCFQKVINITKFVELNKVATSLLHPVISLIAFGNQSISTRVYVLSECSDGGNPCR